MAREHARGDAVELGVESVGEGTALVGDAVAVGVFDQADHFALDREILGLGAKHLVVQGDAILDGARGEVEFEHAHVVADVEHAGAIAVGLGDEQASLLVEIEGHRIREHGLGGPQLGFETRRQREALERQRRIVGRGIDDGCRKSLERLEFQRLRGHHRCAGNQQDSETGD